MKNYVIEQSLTSINFIAIVRGRFFASIKLLRFGLAKKLHSCFVGKRHTQTDIFPRECRDTANTTKKKKEKKETIFLLNLASFKCQGSCKSKVIGCIKQCQNFNMFHMLCSHGSNTLTHKHLLHSFKQASDESTMMNDTSETQPMVQERAAHGVAEISRTKDRRV